MNPSNIHPTAQVHPSAIIEEGAVIGENCQIGPFSIIGANVTLGRGVVVKPHGVVTGWTDIGDETVVFSFAVVGEIPQDLKYKGEKTRLSVGKHCCIREGATLSVGTQGGGGHTWVGDHCLLMTGAHIGHDSIVGDRVVLANQVAIAGHCQIADDVIIGGLSAVHQWVRIGKGSIIGGMTGVARDVFPYAMVQGPRGVLDGLNLIGLKRRGLNRHEIASMRTAYQSLVQGEGLFLERVQKLADETDSSFVKDITQFILADTGRSFLMPK